mmetsp:Transcript_33360/g.78038  ORF Transcript_33360/g.78038 Transcript_33360/m.78038 type:complete len:218 (+) Transcript_33360:1230-1883(+)
MPPAAAHHGSGRVRPPHRTFARSRWRSSMTTIQTSSSRLRSPLGKRWRTDLQASLRWTPEERQTITKAHTSWRRRRSWWSLPSHCSPRGSAAVRPPMSLSMRSRSCALGSSCPQAWAARQAWRARQARAHVSHVETHVETARAHQEGAMRSRRRVGATNRRWWPKYARWSPRRSGVSLRTASTSISPTSHLESSPWDSLRRAPRACTETRCPKCSLS